ncbi:response regulator [Reichenbachiella agarivorans]|uniref:Response regulator n=1 Tax=Reichenbachiella agarivorans TaxID=2979464 RepID=A0ABY6CLU1_9BACT|nr:response regulator [Reichenbachiella agarivorans]UXP31479.1 response regulator [Reichenbachiella agarivorans]
MELVLQRPEKKETVKKYSVLYVDDEPVNLRIFQHAFKRDYNVFTAVNGYDALELLNEEKIDLIITDQQMPRMSGVDLLAKIVPKHPNIIRMIMTGFSDIGAIIRAVNEFGLDKYLVKPWDRDQLKVEFDKALEKKEKEGDRPANHVNESVIKMNDSILPRQSDLQDLIAESFILYDNNMNNKYSYWFGEKDEKVVVAFFNTESNKAASLALKSYISLSLSEIIYKGVGTDTSLILTQLFAKIRSKFADANDLVESLDISIAVLDQSSRVMTFSGANQNIYYFDENDKLKMLNGDSQSFHLKDNNMPDLKVVSASQITEAYFISKNMVNQIIPSSNSATEGVSFLQYMRGMRGKSMVEQAQDIANQLTGDKSKCMLGIHL